MTITVQKQSKQSESTISDRQNMTFPQTSETTIIEPAHPHKPAHGQEGLTTNARQDGSSRDDYIRHADSVSPTGGRRGTTAPPPQLE
jgi:hypothetical protein